MELGNFHKTLGQIGFRVSLFTDDRHIKRHVKLFYVAHNRSIFHKEEMRKRVALIMRVWYREENRHKKRKKIFMSQTKNLQRHLTPNSIFLLYKLTKNLRYHIHAHRFPVAINFHDTQNIIHIRQDHVVGTLGTRRTDICTFLSTRVHG